MTEEELINSYNLDQMKRILRTIYFLMSDYMKKNLMDTCDKFLNSSVNLENKADYYLLYNFLLKEQKIREQKYKPRKKGK